MKTCTGPALMEGGEKERQGRSAVRQALKDLPIQAEAPERTWGGACLGGPFMDLRMSRQVLQGLPGLPSTQGLRAENR